MRLKGLFVTLLLWALLFPNISQTKDDSPIVGPQAVNRPYGQNYKDMVLAGCIARAYSGNSEASKDADYSASVYIEWTKYDLENSHKEIDALIEKYLALDYQNPLVEYQGIKFDLLKCFDLYHSKELASQVDRFVENPNRTYRQDYPSSKN
jgi:hypothetical protein